MKVLHIRFLLFRNRNTFSTFCTLYLNIFKCPLPFSVQFLNLHRLVFRFQFVQQQQKLIFFKHDSDDSSVIQSSKFYHTQWVLLMSNSSRRFLAVIRFMKHCGMCWKQKEILVTKKKINKELTFDLNSSICFC